MFLESQCHTEEDQTRQMENDHVEATQVPGEWGGEIYPKWLVPPTLLLMWEKNEIQILLDPLYFRSLYYNSLVYYLLNTYE